MCICECNGNENEAYQASHAFASRVLALRTLRCTGRRALLARGEMRNPGVLTRVSKGERSRGVAPRGERSRGVSASPHWGVTCTHHGSPQFMIYTHVEDYVYTRGVKRPYVHYTVAHV